MASVWWMMAVVAAVALVGAERDQARLFDPAASRKTNKAFDGGGDGGGSGSTGAGGAALVFAEGLRQLLERHLLGVCDPPAQSQSGIKVEGGRRSGAGGNWTASGIACAPEDPRELPAKLAELSLRASMLSRSRACDNHLSISLAHALSDLARKSSRAPPIRTKGTTSSAEAVGASEKKRKLSKSQKNKLQAKQKTALAVKKKAAAVAAAAALNSKLRSELPA